MGVCRKFESFVGNLGGFAPSNGKSEFPPLSSMYLYLLQITPGQTHTYNITSRMPQN